MRRDRSTESESGKVKPKSLNGMIRYPSQIARLSYRRFFRLLTGSATEMSTAVYEHNVR